MQYLACLPDADIDAMAQFLAGNSTEVATNDDDTDDESGSDDDHSGGGGSGDLPLLALLAAFGLLKATGKKSNRQSSLGNPMKA